ncbi:MAG: HAD family phosphatase [Anaerolineaceae bacterium]
MTIDTVIFDLGGVLIHLPDSEMLEKRLRSLGVDHADKLAQIILDSSNSQVFWDIMRGKIKEHDYWQQAAIQWNIQAESVNRLQKSFNSPENLNQDMVLYFKALKGRYKLGILSNAGDSARKTMITEYHFDRIVDEIVISAEEGYAKPDREIYAIAVKRLKTAPEACLFVDDLIENIEAAKVFGMETIHYQNAETAIQLLNERLNGQV